MVGVVIMRDRRLEGFSYIIARVVNRIHGGDLCFLYFITA